MHNNLTIFVKEDLDEVEEVDIFNKLNKITKFEDFIFFDVYVWSEFKEINSVVKAILDYIPQSEQDSINHYRHYLKVILINLFVGFMYGDKYIAYHRAKGRYKHRSMYSKVHVHFKKTLCIIDKLASLGLIENKKGIHDRTNNGLFSKISRMKAVGDLRALFEKLENKGIQYSDNFEPIILKDMKKERVEYKNTPTPTKMREKIHVINELLSSTDISLPLTQGELNLVNKLRRGLKMNPILLHRKTLYRVFNDGSFKQGGRFYGGFWQLISENARKTILIDGGPTCELDFSAIHPTILYIKKTKALPEPSPYILNGYEHDDQMRNVVKLAFLIFINAKDKMNAIYALKKKAEKELREEDYLYFSKLDCLELLHKLKKEHRPISRYFCTGHGTRLQNIDSELAEYILYTLAQEKIACLPIHDSFIVRKEYKERLRSVMLEACIRILGVELKIK